MCWGRERDVDKERQEDAIVGSANGGRGHKPSKAEGLQKLGQALEPASFRASRGNTDPAAP